jgi:uncharacterized protein (DUF1015 family)
MANIHPFRPLRYTAKAGRLENLATQPYDTISPELASQYRELSPYNLVRLILPGSDYAGAGERFREWMAEGILQADEAPALFVYEQRFCLPESNEPLVRRGFIGLGDCEDYGAIVHRHERTLDAPKAGRLDLLRHTRAQFGSIFMLYDDPAGAVDSLLENASRAAPAERFTDRQGTTHTLWRVDDAVSIARIQAAMKDKKLIIADGHHRYEAALMYRREQPGLASARRTMMTFVNIRSPGLRSLAAHRVIFGLDALPAEALTKMARPLAAVDELADAWAETPAGRVRFGMMLPDGLRLLEFERAHDELNLTVLHREVLENLLGIGPEAIAAERFVRYVRGMKSSMDEVRSGRAQAAFLVEPLRVEDVARLALSGETLPQKSTDFYPKLHSGLTIYRLDG